jgi:YcaO-like protein with predicted kinase domain
VPRRGGLLQDRRQEWDRVPRGGRPAGPRRQPLSGQAGVRLRIRDRVPKVNGSGAHRECASEQTYERIRPYFRHIGITRVADLTGLDRVGIPVYDAIVPRSNDTISAYHGKGLTAIDAKTSAVMEAVERFSGGLPLRPDAVAAYDDLASAGRAVMHPAELNIELHPRYRDDLPIYWLTGHDLLTEEEVLVPHGAVSYIDSPGEPPCYELTTSNGLASGNSLEEAICHALCELVERDAMTIYEVVGERLDQILGTEFAPPEVSQIDLDTLPQRVQELVAKFRDAGLDLWLVPITSDIGVPAVMASTSEGDRGYGTHPDLEVALIRAITECAQGRAVAPQAGREQKRADQVSAKAADLPSYPSDDVAADIRFILDRLSAGGLPRAVLVDVSPPHIPVHAVRMLVPGLESWAIDRSKLGDRATRAWNQAVQAIMDGS